VEYSSARFAVRGAGGRLRTLAATALVLAASGLGLSGCGGPGTGDKAGGSGRNELLLVSYAVTKSAYDRILPGFKADWKQKTGQDLTITTSYGGSGSQTRAVIDGLEADVVTLALSDDVQKLQAAGLVQPGWEQELPDNSVITRSVVALITREGNPKGLRQWSDLSRPGIAVVTANPKTSGGARWNVLALWGSVKSTGGSDAQAAAFLGSIVQQVPSLPRDAREASDVFLKRNQGDVLLNYENEAILARRSGNLKGGFVVPSRNISIEGPVAVVDRHVDRHGNRKAAEALAAYLQSEPAQQIFAEEGFRPVNAKVWNRVKDRFAPVPELFTVASLGGWPQVDQTLFRQGGLWDQLLRQRRR
jgi:sulfate transport system substrate-binding protein